MRLEEPRVNTLSLVVYKVGKATVQKRKTGQNESFYRNEGFPGEMVSLAGYLLAKTSHSKLKQAR